MKKEDLGVDKTSMQKAIKKALSSYAEHKDMCKRDDRMIVVDYSAPSYQKRLHVVDLESKEVISSHHCAHGVGSSGSNPAYAVKFSDDNMSKMTSLGAMVTAETYHGHHGYSLRLDGLETNVNGQVRRRYIVIHSASYVTDKYILASNRAGQSWGCPALDPAISKKLIQESKEGVFFYAYYK